MQFCRTLLGTFLGLRAGYCIGGSSWDSGCTIDSKVAVSAT